MSDFYIKTNRIFSPWRKYAWIFTLTVAIGGLWFPLLGLLVLPVMLGLTVTAFFRGRYWCGNICPHGSLFDRLIYPVTSNRKIPKFFKSKLFGWAFFAFFSFNLVRKFIAVSALWGTFRFWERLGFIFVASYLMVTVVGGLASLLISARTWCNFCPMGTLQKISYTMGKWTGANKETDKKITTESTAMCHSCGKCARVCPMQLTPYEAFDENGQFVHENCIRCSTCVYNCPADVLHLASAKEAKILHEGLDLTGYEHRKTFPATIARITPINETTNEYVFKFDAEDVTYHSGQFILVKIQDIPEMYRAYSISNFDEEEKTITIDVKKAPNGYGTGIIFDNFNKGQRVMLQGPMGHELLVDRSAKEVVLVAGGIGITPFRAIVKDLVENEEKHDIERFTLIYGANTEKEFLFDEEFENYAAINPRFEYVKVVAFDDAFKGPKGFVTDILKDMDLQGNKIYMCGPPPMTNAAKKMLLSMEVPAEDISYESA